MSKYNLNFHNIVIDGMIYETIFQLFYLTFLYLYLTEDLIYLIYGNRIEKLIDKIEYVTFEMPQVLLEEFKLFNILTRISFFGIFFYDLFVNIVYYKTDQFCEGRIKTNDSRYRCGYHGGVWFPFQEDSVIPEWILRLWFTFGEVLFSAICVATFMALFGLIRFVAVKMQHYRSKLEAIDEKNILMFPGKVEFFVRNYEDILECVRELNDSVGYMLVGAYTFLTALLSLSLYLSIMGRRYPEVMAVVVCYIFELIVCQFGQNLEDEHNKLVTAACNLPWYVLSPKQRKVYSLFLGYIGTPVHIKAQPLFFVNYQLLLSVTQAAYKMLMFMANTTH